MLASLDTALNKVSTENWRKAVKQDKKADQGVRKAISDGEDFVSGNGVESNQKLNSIKNLVRFSKRKKDRLLQVLLNEALSYVSNDDWMKAVNQVKKTEKLMWKLTWLNKNVRRNVFLSFVLPKKYNIYNHILVIKLIIYLIYYLN